MKEKITITFDIQAGTYDSDGVNYKYCDNANNLPEALHKYSNTQGYPFRELCMNVGCDGHTTTHYLFGGPMLEQRMRMVFAHLWGMATGNKFVDISMDWEEQAEDIERVLAGLSPVSWQDVHRRFITQQITWTEAFDALMSQCGMPMEDALRCLAENFDRRPAITATEVSDANG